MNLLAWLQCSNEGFSTEGNNFAPSIAVAEFSPVNQLKS